MVRCTVTTLLSFLLKVAHMVVEVVEDAVRPVNSGKRPPQPVPLLILVVWQRPASKHTSYAWIPLLMNIGTPNIQGTTPC